MTESISVRPLRPVVSLWTSLLVATLSGCGNGATEPVPSSGEDLFVLNSTGQTLASFSVQQTLEASGSPIDLGAGFDGDAFDRMGGFAVTTVSSFGGSRVLFVDLGTGRLLTSVFPAPEADLANPSTASFDPQGSAWVGGRGSDAIYRVNPGDSEAQRVASNVGTFVEKVVPVGDRLYVVDANIDDDGGSYTPLGPGRIVVMSRSGGDLGVIDLPPGAFDPTDAVEAAGQLIVLAAGTFDPGTFLPANDGSLVSIDLGSGAASPPVALRANGVSLELGADGLVYVTATSDYQTLNLLRFDPASGSFTRGPSDPISVRGADGHRVDCWSATALVDGRIVCATFSFVESGRLVLGDEGGAFIDEIESGFGTTDLAIQ